MKVKEITIDLSKPPNDRWNELIAYKDGFNALIEFFSGEILELVPPEYLSMLDYYTIQYLKPEYKKELNTISEVMQMPLQKVIVGNLYYDALKIVLGCSAFSTNTINGNIHARNLDWYSNDNDLSNHTLVKRYINGKNEYITVGWPGFTGCLSGMAIGKFSISLNAVSSSEKYTLAQPVVFLIRQTLEYASNFNEAVQQLSTKKIASDCLLMVCGISENEMVVIERTPTKSKIRNVKNGKIIVTNDYKLIENEVNLENKQLTLSSCGRYNKIDELLNKNAVLNNDDVYKILVDPEVKMGITMQQMCFKPATGEYTIFE